MKSVLSLSVLLFLVASVHAANLLRAGGRRLSSSPCGNGNTIGQATIGARPPSRFGGGAIRDVEISEVATDTSVEYLVTFENLWTATNHPPDYPSNAHWSEPVGGSHNCDYQMWKPREEASEGVVRVAELGSTGTIRDELEEEQDDGNVYTIFVGSTTRDFIVSLDPEHSLLSLVTMIAPSPDWFAGVHDLYPASSNEKWWSNFVVDLLPYDAGSDGGNTYKAPNDALEERLDIAEITADSYPETQVFVKDGGVLPVARLSFELIQDV